MLQQSHGTEVNVTDGKGKLCLYANLMVNFSVTYEITGNKVSVTSYVEMASKAAPLLSAIKLLCKQMSSQEGEMRGITTKQIDSCHSAFHSVSFPGAYPAIVVSEEVVLFKAAHRFKEMYIFLFNY